ARTALTGGLAAFDGAAGGRRDGRAGLRTRTVCVRPGGRGFGGGVGTRWHGAAFLQVVLW
ncbi:hypothetical protein, partial [Streptomyces yatensis]|uniref:hypothetical protein n=1 Tax=Streptomyces yatensis TaxID=155177 RepID=UPI0031D16DB8